jgi:hypothetical protein
LTGCAIALAMTAAGNTSHAQDLGKDFIDDARRFHRVVACAGNAAPPAGVDVAVVDAHCQKLSERITRFRKRYVDRAQAFFAKVLPPSLPSTVVYPFGGGDLVSALVTYPGASEYTTISLEHAGDPTRLTRLTAPELKEQLSVFRDVVRGLLVNNDSASENMRILEKGAIPGQLSFFITGLAVMGYEPTSLRYFTLADDGSLRYLGEAEIAALSEKTAKRKKDSWVDTDYSEAFTHMELQFRAAGDPSAPIKVHRHFAANLANDGFVGSPLEKHLQAKATFVAMTKAASYLLWLRGFSGIREFLLGGMVLMVSDSTGIPPRFARKAGFSQTVYGVFTGSYLPAADRDNEDFRQLWSTPRKKLRFRYGYPDVAGNLHLMITTRRKR